MKKYTLIKSQPINSNGHKNINLNLIFAQTFEKFFGFAFVLKITFCNYEIIYFTSQDHFATTLNRISPVSLTVREKYYLNKINQTMIL